MRYKERNTKWLFHREIIEDKSKKSRKTKDEYFFLMHLIKKKDHLIIYDRKRERTEMIFRKIYIWSISEMNRINFRYDI